MSYIQPAGDAVDGQFSTTYTQPAGDAVLGQFGGQAPAGTKLKYWDGTSWVLKPLRRWDGTRWNTATLKRWNGNAWVAIQN